MIIALVGTGTAGHIYAAMALAEELKTRGHEVHFLASQHGIENQLLDHFQADLHQIPSKPFFRVGHIQKLSAISSFLCCINVARKTLASIKADCVIGFGGHVSAASIIAGKLLGIHTVIHEANALAGRGNKIVKHAADKIFLGMLARSFHSKPSKESHIDLPVRRSVYQGAPRQRDHENPLHILVLGGSEGAEFLNKNAPLVLDQLIKQGLPLTITHIAGTKGLKTSLEAYAALKLKARIIDYAPNIETLYEQTDFILSSSGAGTLAELSIWGIPFFLLPLASAAENHQEENAIAFIDQLGLDSTAGKYWISETNWETDQIAKRIHQILSDQNKNKQISNALIASVQTDATKRFADEVELLHHS